MDRNKMSGSNNKKKMPLGSEFYALGTKSGRDEKSKITPASSKSGNTSLDRKREATSVISNISKKPKLLSLRSTGDLGAPSGSNNSSSSAASSSTSGGMGSGGGMQHELWEQMATECEPLDIAVTINSAVEQHDNDAVVRLLCGGIKQMTGMNQRLKPDSIIYLVLPYVAKIHPEVFCNDTVTSALLSLLRRDPNMKTRPSANSHVVASNLLARGYNSKTHWPEIFLRTYIDDAINERYWADNELCVPFIENICSAFQTKVPTQALLQLESGAGTPTTGSGSGPNSSGIVANAHPLSTFDDDSGDNSIHGLESNSSTGEITVGSSPLSAIVLPNRFADCEALVEKLVVDAIKEQLNKRQQQDCYTRNLLKFLCTTSGIYEVRHLCIARLELWLHSGKLVKFAQQLLAYICCNVKCRDHEVLGILVKMRLKTKPLINFYMTCLKEMINQQPDILAVVLKFVVQNELSNTRNPNNMGMLATMFQTSPEQSAVYLAEIYKELLLQRDDCLRTLRVFLRELVRMLRFDINVLKFCKVFLSETPEQSKQIEQSEFKERIFHSMVDITCLCMLLSVSPQVREANMGLRTNRDIKSNPVLIKFYAQMSQIQLDAVSWMYETVPNLFKLPSLDYNQALHKLLLLENPDQYSRYDQWPSEPERATLLRIASETPIHEDTLLRIILIGITKEIPLTIPDSIEIIMLVTKRASSMRFANCPAVQANKFDIIDFLFSMAEYHHPENIKLPANYEPPKLAIIVLYWKAWLILLMISAHNPSTFGAFCWENYPTMKMLMEMCITNQFNESSVSKEELQILTLERDHILEFESYLAAQTSQAIITEENAILISQLMLMDPMGPARRVPTVVMEQLRYLNKSLKLGHLLCRSRKPDLLLDIIQRQGTTQSMPWLSDLVQNSEGDFNHLPVQCLCEFLLFNATIINEDNSRDAELVNFLRNLILEPGSSKQTVCEVLDYIFRRLSSTVKQSRTAALGGLKIIFKCSEYEENDWLLRALPRIPFFIDVRAFIIPQLRAACQVENCPKLVMAYIQFIAAYTLNDPVTDMLDHVIDMAQLIVERSTMFQHIIPAAEDLQEQASDMPEQLDVLQENRYQTLKCLFVMFNNYIIKLQEHHEPYEWTEYPDLLLVQFDDGVQLPLHLNIIHAFIILLTHSSNTIPESMPILDYWFPPGRPAPIGFVPTVPHEPVQLLPDWLKLKMIRSSVDRLIEAALHGLTPDQIVLFVQNFGTPINSMSKLLALLDHAVTDQIEEVKQAILNKAYLAQLIEIQQARGAKNGHFTVQALGLHSHSQTVPDLPKLCHHMLESFDFAQIQQAQPPPMAVVETTSSNSKASDAKAAEEVVRSIVKGQPLHDGTFRKFIHQLLEHGGVGESSTALGRKSSEPAITKAYVNLLQQLESSKPLQRTHFDMPQVPHTYTFLRVLLSHQPTNESEGQLQSHVLIKLNALYDRVDLTPQHVCMQSLIRGHNRRHNAHKSPMAASVQQQQQQQQQQHMLKSQYLNEMYAYSNNIKSVITTAAKGNTNPLGAERRCAVELSHSGLLVDWLAEIDPELTILPRHLQVNYLFSKSCQPFRFYLLSLICHQTNWETLVATLKHLLTQQSLHAEIDSTMVLNFIDALINNPKLWQGREKTVSKSDKREVIFCLCLNELETFAQLLLREGEVMLQGANATATTATATATAVDAYNYQLCSRIQLLLRLINRSSAALVRFIDFTMHHTSSSGALPLRNKVLQQVYLMYPSIKFIKGVHLDECAFSLQALKGCEADHVSNYLITCLGNLVLKKDFESLSSDTELLLRKLASSHPALLLRQLGVLASFIQGRAQMSMRVLREEHHSQRFVQILRMLEILQPLVFDDVYKQELQKALTCYFTFFKHHNYVKETYHIMIKFVELLQSYINVNPSCALLFIEQYVDVLTELSNKFTSVASLHQLIQGIALLQHKGTSSSTTTGDQQQCSIDEMKQDFDYEDQTSSSTGGGGGGDSKGGGAGNDAEIDASASNASNSSSTFEINSRGAAAVFAISGYHNRSTTVSPHFLNLIKIIKQSNTEDAILSPLQEIESLSSKRFSFLSELFDRLLELIFSPSAQIRSNAFILLIRHLKHNPGRTDLNRCTLNAYIQCLRDDNSSVAATAVDNLSEMTLLLQEHAIEILAVTFSLGIRSRLNTYVQIKRVLQTLMLQHGY